MWLKIAAICAVSLLGALLLAFIFSAMVIGKKSDGEDAAPVETQRKE